MTNSKKDISQIDWLDHEHLTLNHTWVIPQCWSWLNKVVKLVKTHHLDQTWSFCNTLTGFVEEVNSGTVTCGDRVVTPTMVKSLWNWLLTSPRGVIVKQQNSSPYNASVPLVLAPFKLYRGVCYQDWDWTDPWSVHWLDKDLYQLVPYMGVDLGYSVEELIEIRNLGSTPRTGRGQGVIRPPRSVTNLVNLPPGNFKSLPRLAKLVLTQCWCWHPTAITPLSIQSLDNWDQAKAPLLEDRVLESITGKAGGTGKDRDLGSTLDIWKL